jgi:PEP-CTERM motif
MKISKIFSIAAVCGCITAAYGETVYSGNIVGYINQPLYPGTNYIANQLANGDNSLKTIFQPSSLLEGTTFTEWNPTTQSFLAPSTYDTTTGWSINYTLTYGQGGVLVNPDSLFVETNTFTGSVWPGFNPISETFTPPLVTGSGLMMLSCYVPIADATFYDVVGRDPLDGDSVTLLDPTTQNYTTTTFDNGSWNNGAPLLGVNESAFFDLVSVPEPGVYALAGVGMLVLGAMRRRA